MKRKRFFKSLYYIILLFIISSFIFGCSKITGSVPSIPKDEDISENNDAGGGLPDLEKDLPDLFQQLKKLSINEVYGELPIIQKDMEKYQVYYSIYDNGDLLVEDFEDNLEHGLEDDGKDVTLSIRNIYTNEKEIIKTIKWPQDTWGSVINSDWVVWKEAMAVGYPFEGIKIYYYNRNTKEIKLLFETPVDKDGNLIKGHIPDISLKGHEVLFDVVIGAVGEGNNSINSRKYNLLTGEYIDIGQQLALPKWADNGYFAIGQDKIRKNYSIVYRISDGNKVPLMQKGAFIYELLTDGESVAITAQRFDIDNVENETQKRSLWLLEEGEEKLIKKVTDEEPDACAWPKMSKRFIAWTSNMEAYAYDRKLDVIVKLSDEETFSVVQFASSKFLVWLSPSDQDIRDDTGRLSRFNIIDIDKLSD